jgi:hypothetical protein
MHWIERDGSATIGTDAGPGYALPYRAHVA